jgi:hypothetical protein
MTRDSERRVSKRGSASPQIKFRLLLDSLKKKRRRAVSDGQLKPIWALTVLFNSTLMAQEAKVTPLMSKDLYGISGEWSDDDHGGLSAGVIGVQSWNPTLASC